MMTATDATTESSVTAVEVPSPDKEKEEGALNDVTSVLSESINHTSGGATAEDNAEENLEEEEKDGKEEDETGEQGKAEQAAASMDIATQRRLDRDNEVKNSSKEAIEPLKLLKKGATAVVGGTMVGVGLVMIPLPTPMGCVVASSGLAILGNEFEGAKEMNERIIDKSKENLAKARDTVISKIESMNSSDSDETDDDTSAGSAKDEEETPTWLNHMNEAERKRQKKLLKQKYRNESMTTNAQFKQYVKRTSGSFLSRTLLPVLNQTKEGSEDETINNSEGCEQLQVETQSTPTNQYSSASESFYRGKQQAKAMFETTAASFSSMMKRMTTQAEATETESKIDSKEQINFSEVAMVPPAPSTKVQNAATAAPIVITGTIATEDSPATANGVPII